ncbi:MAG: hypothetical protein ACOXZV_14205 [Bacteroidales bacterium]|jgi:hypothetical protein
MKIFRLIMIVVSVLFILLALLLINYRNLMSRSNLGSFLVIISMLFNILAIILSKRYEARNKSS